MGRPLRVLFAEDSPDDAELVTRELQRAGFDVSLTRVDTREQAAAALAAEPWDVILADYAMPALGLSDMLDVLEASAKDIPLIIIVSGAIGEQEAVAAMRRGARDYVYKQNLARLGACVERELREAEARGARRAAESNLELLGEAIDSANDVVLILDGRSIAENGLPRIIYANEALERQAGYKPSEVLGKTSEVFFGPLTDFGAIATMQSLTASSDPISMEMINYRKDGSHFWVEVNSRPVIDASGKVARWISVRHDISRRKLTEEALRGSEERYRALFEANPNPMLVYDLETLHYVAVNEAAVRLYGYSRQEFLSMTVRDIRPPEDLPKFEQLLKEPRKTFYIEAWRHRKRDGSIIDVEIAARSMDWKGRPSRLVLVRDVTERKRAEEERALAQAALQDSSARLNLLFEQMPAVLWTTDANLVFTSSQGAGLADLGLQPNQVRGMSLFQYFQTDDPQFPAIAAHRRALGGEANTFEVEWAGRTYQSHVEPMRDLDGGILGVIGVALDVTGRRQAELAVRKSEQSLAAAQGMARLGSWEADLGTGDIQFSDEFYRIHGLAPGEDLKSLEDVRSFWHPDDTDLMQRTLAEARAAGKPYSVEHRIVLRDGTVRHVLAQGEFKHDQQGRPGSASGIILDITERKQAQEKLWYFVQHDLLTELPNRVLLADRLTLSIAHAQRSDRYAAVLFFDLNRFKQVNETVGRAAGDDLLCAVARRLSENVRTGDTVARVGADEFVIALADLGQPEDAIFLTRKLLDVLAEPFAVAGKEIFASASVGISLHPLDGTDADSLIRNAESAMFRAKEHGDNAFQLFTSTMHATAVQRLSLESDLHKALERDEFVVHYQPFVDIAAGSIVGAEALVRWQHPTLGLLAPDRFISLAEETGLIGLLAESVLGKACAEVRRWHASGFGPLRIAVNISPRQFRDQKLTASIERILHDTGLESKFLELEITEGVVMKGEETSLGILHRLKSMGVRLSVDDFGTGYSSLGYLKQFPIDTLKIDRAFVREVSVDPFDEAIADTIVTLGHSLRLRVVAEGVETQAQVDRLRDLRCDEMQGFYFCRPLPADAFERLFTAGAYLGGMRVKRAMPAGA